MVSQTEVRNDLFDLSVADMAEFPVDRLAFIQRILDADSKTLKSAKEKVEQAIERRYAERAKQRRAEEGKDTGTVRFEDHGFEIEAELPKKVEWDNALLRKAFDTMSEEDAQHYAKVKIEVEEAKFTKAPPAIQKLLSPARTVKTGKATFKIHPPKLAEVE